MEPGATEEGSQGRAEREPQPSPLLGRAAFMRNWGWEVVIHLNQRSCLQRRTQFGHSPSGHELVRQQWESRQAQELTLGEALDFLLECHRAAPFLFHNDATFGEIARQMVEAFLVEFPPGRRREAAFLAAHYVGGRLDRESMALSLDALTEVADLKPGDRVRTFRGSAHGVVLELWPDGRVVWQPDGTTAELIASAESLLRELG